MVTPQSSAPSALSRLLGVPVAIILAGGLVAFAIYFGGGKSTPTPPTALTEENAEPTVGNFRPVDDTDHIRGPATARVTIIEYSDLECPFCKQFQVTMRELVAAYPNDVRWVYRHFPLEQLHSKAPQEAIATECAGEQGKFWELTDKIFEVTPANNGLNLEQLPTLAASVGVADIPAFSACLTSDRHRAKVDADYADARTAGGQGTPYSIIIGPTGEPAPISGAQPLSVLKAAVEPYLQF